MRLIAAFALRSINNGVSRRFHSLPPIGRSFSTSSNSARVVDDINNSEESVDEFERRIFSEGSESGPGSGSSSSSDSFFRRLERIEKAHGRLGPGMNDGGGTSSIMDGLDESFNTLSDGLDGKLKKAATYFEYDPEEVAQNDYSFRPDVKFMPGSNYEIKDLDLTKPRVNVGRKKFEFETTTKEVLKNADFRNVRFLANFLTEAGIIVKRSKTGISAKAQRKIAREIKTARAFGLLPFTTMGTKAFVFGKSMEDGGEDFEYDIYDGENGADVGKD